jgi:alkyl sulfatase BDS1-like metallo-beta-lactamase superfamily hydrolase
VVEFLSVQRDLYAYLHDQTVRLLNQGLTGPEIAEAVQLPPALEPDLIAQLTPQQLFDTLAIRVNGPRCWDEHPTVDVDLTDVPERWRLTLRNGVLTYTRKEQAEPAGVTLRLPLAALPALAVGMTNPAMTVEGDASVLDRLRAALDEPEPNFPIVTP